MSDNLLVNYSEFVELVEREVYVHNERTTTLKCSECLRYALVFGFGMFLVLIGSFKENIHDDVRALLILIGTFQSSVILYPCYEIYEMVLGSVQENIMDRSERIL